MPARIFLLGILTLALSSTVAQIGAKANSGNAVVGIWISTQFGFDMVLMLNADKTGEFDGTPFTYTVNDKSLTLKSEGVETSYQFELKANQLTLSGGDLVSNVMFSRKAQDNSSSQAATINTTPEPLSKESASIVGSWSGGGEVLEFRSDGQCMISGQAVSYQYNPPWIELNGPGGSIKIETSFTDKDHMNLKVNSNLVPYTRSGATANVTAQGNTNAASSGGQIDMTMVGKWCATNVNSYNEGSSYSSTCITLNADGTYVYASESERDVNTSSFWAGTNSQGNDAGKWWVQGDRIYYNSPTKGQGSYHFEKRNHPKNVSDPMLVIEGTSYVTAYQKAPW